MKITRGMRQYLKRASVTGLIPVTEVKTVGAFGRWPRPLFECVEADLLDERRADGGSSCEGHSLHYKLLGWTLTDKGRDAIAKPEDQHHGR